MTQTSPNTHRSGSWFLVLIPLVAALVFLTDGFPGLGLLLLAVCPVTLFLHLLRLRHKGDVSCALYTEMAVTGGVISIMVASVLEFAAQFRTLPVWQCEQSPFFTWQCDLLFLVVVTIAVGLSEEFAKLAPLSRLKRSLRHLPKSRFFRVVDTPVGMCLCGCAVAGGFACIENIKYVLKAGRIDFRYGVDTALLRSLLAIPFHICCTGFAAALYARQGFIIPNTADDVPSVMDNLALLVPKSCLETETALPVQDIEAENSSQNHYQYISHESQPAFTQPPVMPAASSARLVYTSAKLATLFSFLLIPMLAHGLYDTGLFLTSQFFNASGRALERSKTLSKQYNLPSTSLGLLLGLVHDVARGALGVSTVYPSVNDQVCVWHSARWTHSLNKGTHSGTSHTPHALQFDPLEELRLAEREGGFFMGLGITSTGVALGAYLLMLVLFLIEFRNLQSFQRKAIPMIHAHYELLEPI